MRKSAKIAAVYQELRFVKGMKATAGELLASAAALVELFMVEAGHRKPANELWAGRQWINLLSIDAAWGHDFWYVFCRDPSGIRSKFSDGSNAKPRSEWEICGNRRTHMEVTRHGLALAAKEHIAGGQPLTRLEAMVLYGVANLPDLIKEMRNQGFVIKSRLVTYAAAAERINRYAVLQPPSNLPVREVHVTEYWLSR